MQRKEVGRIFRFVGFEEQFGEEVNEVFLFHSFTRKQVKIGERAKRSFTFYKSMILKQ